MKGKTKIMKDILKSIIIIIIFTIILFYIARLTVIIILKLANFDLSLGGYNIPFPEVDTMSWWKLW